MAKYLGIAIVGLALLGAGFIFINNNDSAVPAAAAAGTLTAIEDHFDFGTVAMAAGNISQPYQVVNQSAAPVTIKKIYTSCMCTTALITDERGQTYGPFGMPGHEALTAAGILVAPGESLTVEAVFDPAAHGPSGVGLAARSIYLETDSPTMPKLELSFEALVIR